MNALIRLFVLASSMPLGISAANAAPENAYVPSDTGTNSPDDSSARNAYIAGYAASILERDFNLEKPTITVKNGFLLVGANDFKNVDRAQVAKELSSIPGVTGVDTQENAGQPSPPNAKDNWIDLNAQPNDTSVLQTGVMPDGHLFKPLLADPRWAHFSVAYHNFNKGDFDGRDIGSVSFGETIPFYRANFGAGERLVGQWEIGIQGAVFSDFNFNAPSTDLINTDFIGSIYSSARIGHFSAFGRVFHQSSHLGDEFLLRTRLHRVNLSYEGVDLKLSYEFPYGIRLYGGGSGIFDKEPATLKTWAAQYGLEFRSPWRFDFAAMRPVIAADFKNFEQNDWRTDISVRAGVQFDNLHVIGRNLQILGEYYNGYSPSGQFYNNKVEYYGIGAHFHF